MFRTHYRVLLDRAHMCFWLTSEPTFAAHRRALWSALHTKRHPHRVILLSIDENQGTSVGNLLAAHKHPVLSAVALYDPLEHFMPLEHEPWVEALWMRFMMQGGVARANFVNAYTEPLITALYDAEQQALDISRATV